MGTVSKNHHTPPLNPDPSTDEFDQYYRELFETVDGSLAKVKTLDDWLDEYWCTVQVARFNQKLRNKNGQP